MVTFTWAAVNALTAAAFDLDLELALAVGLAGGLAADVVISLTGTGPANRPGTMLTLSDSPLVAWSAYFLGIGFFGDLRWSPVIWGGAIVFTAMSGLALTTLSRHPWSAWRKRPLR